MSSTDPEVRYPVFVAEGHDVSMYKSVDALRGDLEPWFVNEPHSAWDSEGRPCQLTLSAGEQIEVELTGGPPEKEGLRKLMVESAEMGGVSARSVDHLSLPEVWDVTVGQVRGYGLFDFLGRLRDWLRGAKS